MGCVRRDVVASSSVKGRLPSQWEMIKNETLLEAGLGLIKAMLQCKFVFSESADRQWTVFNWLRS